MQALTKTKFRQIGNVIELDFSPNLEEVESETATTVSTPVALRPLYKLLGCASLAIGFINQFIPGLPSTVFYLIALWAFKRSSPRLEHWLLHRSPMGPALRDWEHHRAMTRRNKVVAIAAVWIGIGSSIALIASRHRPNWQWLCGLLFVIAICVTVFLVKVQSKEELGLAEEIRDQLDGSTAAKETELGSATASLG